MAVEHSGLIFDLDGTLYSQRAVRRGMAARLALHCAARPITGMRLVRGLGAYRRSQEELRRRGARGADLAAAQLRLAAVRTGIPEVELAGMVRQWFEAAPLSLVRRAIRPELVQLLEKAAAHGVRLGVLSDYPPEPKLAALGIRDHFHTTLAAQDVAVGCFKPEPDGLLAIADLWRLPPSACLYIGDRHEVDAEAARRAGMMCFIVGRRGRGAAHHYVRNMGELTQALYSGRETSARSSRLAR